MKRILSILACVCLLMSISAFADSYSFTNLNVSLAIEPNEGFGDNVFGTISGPGVNLTVGGGTPVDWFTNTNAPGYLPGSSGGGTMIYWDYASGTIGGKFYSDVEIGLEANNFNAGGFTFPTNGQSVFTVKVPASIAIIEGSIINTDTPFTLLTKPGVLTLTFTYDSYWGWCLASSGSFMSTPEPSTLVLMGIGLGGMALRKYKSLLAPAWLGSRTHSGDKRG